MNAAPSVPEKRQYQFDQFRVDPVRRLLLKDGDVVPITPKSFAILLILLERRGQVVDKKLLIEQVWSDAYVTEANLTQNISSLRKVLGERAGDCRYVVTLPGQGYSFVAEVTFAAGVPFAEGVSEAVPEAPAPGPPAGAVQAGSPEAPALSEDATGPLAAMAPGVRRFRRRAAGLGIAALVFFAASALFLLDVHRSETELRQETPAAVARRPSIAVLDFYNLSGSEEASWLAPALAELLTTELSAGGQVRVISGESVARARGELSPDSAGNLDGSSLRRLHSLLGADRVVLGSYLSLPGAEGRRVRLDLRVLELPSGTHAAALTETGTEAELFELVSRAGTGLRHALGLAAPSPEQSLAVRAQQPATPRAASLYAQGLARLRSFDYLGAQELLLQAAVADPSSAPIHAALSHAWSELGNDAGSVGEARKALKLAAPLSRGERLVIEARLYEARREWNRASEIYRSLWTFYPDEIEYGLLLAGSLEEAGRSSDALEVIRELRRLPSPAGDDPRIDLVEATVAGGLADADLTHRAAEAAERAAAKGRSAGEPLVVAQALMLQGNLLLRAGNPREAAERFREARGLFETSGHRWGMVRALAGSGLTLHRMGDLGEAEKVYLQVQELSRQLGSASGVAAQNSNLGRLYLDRGQLGRSLEHLEKAHVYLAENKNSLQEARILNLIGSILTTRGDLDAAAERHETALALSRKVGFRDEQARSLAYLAAALAWKGQLGEARRNAEGALQLLRDLRRPVFSAVALRTSADVLVRLGDLPLARQRFENAIELQRQVGDRIGLARLLGARGRLALREGDLPLARRLGEEQLRLGRETGVGALEAEALRLLGGIELAAGEIDRARGFFTAALRAGQEMGETLEAAAVRLDLARLDFAAGRPAEAARAAQSVAAWAAPRGAESLEVEALAVVAEALLRQGNLAAARAAADRVGALAERSEDRSLRASLAPVLARAEAAGGDVPGALSQLRRSVAEAARLGFVAAALDGRFTLAELELWQGDPERGRSALEAVRRDAEARGLRHLAAAALAVRERVLKNAGASTL